MLPIEIISGALFAGLLSMLYFCSSTYSVGLNVSCFHLSQEVSGGEFELILQVNLQQSIVVTNIILSTCRGNIQLQFRIQKKLLQHNGANLQKFKKQFTDYACAHCHGNNESDI